MASPAPQPDDNHAPEEVPGNNHNPEANNNGGGDIIELPYPATSLVIAQCFGYVRRTRTWAAFLCASFYDDDDNELWHTEILIGSQLNYNRAAEHLFGSGKWCLSSHVFVHPVPYSVSSCIPSGLCLVLLLVPSHLPFHRMLWTILQLDLRTRSPRSDD